MDRRAFLKTSSLMMGGLTLSSLVSPSQAAQVSAKVLSPLSAEHPLLLNFNENSLGMSQKAQQAVIDALPTAFRYPDDARASLIQQIAAHFAVNEQQITLGNGSSETIQAAVQMLAAQAAKQGQKVQLVAPDPTFNYAELYAQPLGVAIEKIPLTSSLAFDLTAMKQKVANFDGLSIIYICNPNNPTAMITAASDLDEWISNAPENQFFIIDEAYAEFVTDPAFISAIELVKKGQKNLIVTRTFSKIYALAGLRIGYGIAAPEVIATTDSFVSIDNTNTAGAVAALASINDTAFVEYSRKTIDASRALVVAALDELGLPWAPSQANFIFHKVNGDVKTYQERMKSQHIMVGREFPPAIGWSRLTLGTPSEMAEFIRVLKQFRTKGWV
nr:histidinol-phosphate transaminase [uncultured Moellerella sp.]